MKHLYNQVIKQHLITIPKKFKKTFNKNNLKKSKKKLHKTYQSFMKNKLLKWLLFLILALVAAALVRNHTDSLIQQINDTETKLQESTEEVQSKQTQLENTKNDLKKAQDAVESSNKQKENLKIQGEQKDEKIRQLERDLQAKAAQKIQLASVVKPVVSEPVAVANNNPVSYGGCELVYNYTNWNQSIAKAVCLAESGGNTSAANYNDNHGQCVGSFGLFQLACFWISNPTNASANVAKANQIYSEQGWQPWGAYTNGSYLSYL